MLETIYQSHKTEEYLQQILMPDNIDSLLDYDDAENQAHLFYRCSK